MLHDPKAETKIRARALLNNAADYMQEHGFCQEAMECDGRVCVLGAVHAAGWCEEVLSDAVSAEIISRLRRLAFRSGMSVVQWNDTPGRTKRQAVGLLRRAAAL